MKVALAWINNPRHAERVHFWGTIAWIFPGVVLAWVIVYRIPPPHADFTILVVSLYANAISHMSAWQAVRAELADRESRPNEPGGNQR